jgi:7-cyano-7-deazaguanine synthase
MIKPERAVILLSGGLDSTTCLAIARAAGYDCYALSVAYGQRHAAELNASTLIAQRMGACEHRIASVSLGEFGGSALTDAAIGVPVDGDTTGIPVTCLHATPSCCRWRSHGPKY